jgi:aminomethyltransferase
MPVRYSGDLAEHHAVRTAAGLFDLTHMGEIEVRGRDAAALLDFALAGKLSAIRVGRAKYSLLCDSDGGVLDDLVVYRLGEERFLVVANAANAREDLQALTERAIGFDAQIVDRTTETVLIAVQGPLSQAIVEVVAPDAEKAVADLRYYASLTACIAGIDTLVARTGYTGEDGFELYVPTEHGASLWRAVLDAGAPHGLVPAGLACRDTLRLEAGMPLYGHELTTSTDPYGARLGRTVALEKNFVGHSALQKLSEVTPARTLAGLVGTGRRAARAGSTVHATDGRVVGVVTSGVLSPTLGHPIALAYLDTDRTEPGTELGVDVRGHSLTFTVSPLPFYRR